MDKLLVLMGITLILIGIGFGVSGLFEPTENLFWQSVGIWTVGCVTLILGLTVFAKEEGFLKGR